MNISSIFLKNASKQYTHHHLNHIVWKKNHRVV